MLAAIVAGEVQVVADPMPSILPHIQSGKLRPLAVTVAARHPKLPDVPSMTELGFPQFVTSFWLGVVAPAGTPPDVVVKLNAAFHESLAPADTRARLDALGADIKVGSPAEFGKLLADELAKWTAVAKAANIKVE
jgi:tripartite-type tricarboxylate transporter receptor subunit TctC